MTLQWDPTNPLARCPGETRKSNVALGDYWRLGPGRSLDKLHQYYIDSTPGQEIPTRHRRTLAAWSTNNAWQIRIDAATAQEQERANAEYEAERRAWRRKRREALAGNFGRVVTALAASDTDGLPVDRVTRALAVVAAELRKEYDDDPATRIEVTIHELDTAIERELARLAPGGENATAGAAGGDAGAETA